ncbi:MAG: hypothetical protein ACLSFT_10355 [Ruminococcus callidus]
MISVIVILSTVVGMVSGMLDSGSTSIPPTTTMSTTEILKMPAGISSDFGDSGKFVHLHAWANGSVRAFL